MTGSLCKWPHGLKGSLMSQLKCLLTWPASHSLFRTRVASHSKSQWRRVFVYSPKRGLVGTWSWVWSIRDNLGEDDGKEPRKKNDLKGRSDTGMPPEGALQVGYLMCVRSCVTTNHCFGSTAGEYDFLLTFIGTVLLWSLLRAPEYHLVSHQNVLVFPLER